MVSYDFQYFNPWLDMDNTDNTKRDAPGTSSTNINITSCPYKYETVRAHINNIPSDGTITSTWYLPSGPVFFTYDLVVSAGGWARFWVGILVGEIYETGVYKVNLSGAGINHDINFTLTGTIPDVTFTELTFRKFSPPILHTASYTDHWNAPTILFPSKNYDMTEMPENYDTFCFKYNWWKGVTTFDVYVYCRIRDAAGQTVMTFTWNTPASYFDSWSYYWFAHSITQLWRNLGTFTFYIRVYRPDTGQTFREYNTTFTVYSSDPSNYRIEIPSTRRVNIISGARLNIQ